MYGVGSTNNNAAYNGYGMGQGGIGGAAPAGEKPKKYVKIDGVMKLNPEYKNYMATQHQKPATTALDQEVALPVVTNMDDHAEYNEAATKMGEPEIELAPAINDTIEIMQEPEIAAQVGMASDEMVDGLGQIFNRHEIPMGLMNKLMMLSELEKIEFLVDDSGSMGSYTDSKDPKTGKLMTRWQEAESRIKEMVEVMAYVPIPKIEVKFLNRRDTITVTRNPSLTPDQFANETATKIKEAFKKGPSGVTPMLAAMQGSFNCRERSVGRYIFADGAPSGGRGEISQIKELVKNRSNAENNPVTFLSCTDQDDQVEWMKDVEEVADYCAELDDFNDEAAEVKKDQGAVFPFTKGFHLISQICAAMNPEDLDAMDESVPFTKSTLDNLLGIKHNEQDYRRYFDGFKKAQEHRPIEGPMDNVKQKANFEAHYHEFLNAPMARDIRFVQEFKQQLKQVEAGGNTGGGMFRRFA